MRNTLMGSLKFLCLAITDVRCHFTRLRVSRTRYTYAPLEVTEVDMDYYLLVISVLPRVRLF
jgi:hypothetical protein